MKNKVLILSVLLLWIFITACSKEEDSTPDIEEGTTEEPVGNTGTPVETNSANTSYKPAFTGQTRIGSVKTVTGYNTQLLSSSLASPWGIASLPDGRLLITQKTGTMRISTTSGQLGAPIVGLPAVNADGQGGLLGLCVDPNFTTNRMLYWVFAENSGGANVTAVAKGRLSNDETRIESATVIYRATPANSSTLHYGGRILFDASGYLLISTGERSGASTRPLAQSVTAAIGKIVRITTTGQAAPGNPSFSGAGALPELYAIGLRNPQGLAIHPVTGDLWQSEHGPRGGDELNRIEAGKNYGWPIITYGIEYGGQVIGSGIQQQEGMEQPAYYWDPVVSPSGMTFYKGNRVPEWQNNLFIGCLSGQHIVRLVITNNKIAGEERLLTNLGQRFRDVTQGLDGALYAVTDQGRLYKIDKE